MRRRPNVSHVFASVVAAAAVLLSAWRNSLDGLVLLVFLVFLSKPFRTYALRFLKAALPFMKGSSHDYFDPRY